MLPTKMWCWISGLKARQELIDFSIPPKVGEEIEVFVEVEGNYSFRVSFKKQKKEKLV